MLPPQRVSYGRSRRRRAHHAMVAITPGMDPVSGMPKLHHRVAAQSGYVRPGLTISVPKLGIGAPKKKKNKKQNPEG
jgi:ribosomal protein L32